MPDLDRAVRSWEEWDRGIRSGDPRSLQALGRLLAAMAERGTHSVTARESEILQLLADGATFREAAEKLGIAEYTVKTHAKRLYAKLGARNRPHAVMIGLREGLIR